MKTLNSKTVIALGLGSAMSLGTASANLPETGTQPLDTIDDVNTPTLTVTVNDGFATLFGDAEPGAEAAMAKEHRPCDHWRSFHRYCLCHGVWDAGTQSLNSVIGVSSATLSVNLDDGVATLFGNAESGAESALAASHVAKLYGVDRVINLISHN